MRIGTGYDVHKLVEDRPLILGGVKIPMKKVFWGTLMPMFWHMPLWTLFLELAP